MSASHSMPAAASPPAASSAFSFAPRTIAPRNMPRKSACERIAEIAFAPLKTWFGLSERTPRIDRPLVPMPTLRAEETKACDTLRPEEDSPPLFAPEDRIFNDDESYIGFLPCRGPAHSPTDAETTTLKILQTCRLTKSQLHGAQLVHGSLSPSLSAFLPNGEGVILPIGLLAQKNRTPFCGTIDAVTEINSHSLSTCWIGCLQGTQRYAKSEKTWTPESSSENYSFRYSYSERYSTSLIDTNPALDTALKREFQDFLKRKNFKSALATWKQISKKAFSGEDPRTLQKVSNSIYMCGLELERQKVWPALPPLQKQLIEDPFGVIYGIKSERPNSHCNVGSAVYGEIGLAGGASAQNGEIRVIFVPPKRVEFVKNLLADNGYGHIPVEGSEHLFRD